MDIDGGLQDNLLCSSGDIVMAAALDDSEDHQQKGERGGVDVETALTRRAEHRPRRVVSGRVPWDSAQT